MQSTACFGSSIAFDPKGDTCKGCAARQQCETQVTAQRPQFLRLLSRYVDADGEKMTFHWLTPAETKKVREGRKQKSLEDAQIATYGDTTTALALRATMHKRCHTTFDKMTLARINISHDDAELVGTFSKAMGAILGQLKAGARTLPQLTDAIVSSCAYTASSARREAQALTSILIAADRVTKRGHTMELK